MKREESLLPGLQLPFSFESVEKQMEVSKRGVSLVQIDAVGQRVWLSSLLSTLSPPGREQQ